MCAGTRGLSTVVIVAGLGVAARLPVAAQQVAATGQSASASAAADRAQLENYIRVLDGELERSEARVASLTAQLVALDQDIESRVGRLVSLLSSVRDSADGSGIRIRQAKEDALAGLKSAALYYAQERDRRKAQIGSAYAPIAADELSNDVAALNARIELRITQSLDIAESLVQHQEGPTGRYQDSDAYESAEYRKLERDAGASVKMKTDLVASLRASIDKLSRETEAREVQLRATTDPQKQAQLTRENADARRTIEARRDQIEELLSGSKPATRPVGSKGAFELDKMLREMASELKSDFSKFKGLVVDRDMARARVKPLKERLAKVQAALDAMPTGAGGAAAAGGASAGGQ